MDGNADLERILKRPLSNITCPYCGADVRSAWTKEHVVGRRFVPAGTLGRSDNLIVRACHGCNNEKSALEDDISAISLGTHSNLDTEHHEEVTRKTRGSFSKRTGRRVSDSVETGEFTGRFGPAVTYTARMHAPPQVDQERAFTLARLQVGAFFYALTYDPVSRRGGYWPGVFMPTGMSMRADWGSAQDRWFMTKTVQWPLRVRGTLAEGYFKVAIRRDLPAEVWSWAVEWNQNFRVVGFFGDEASVTDLHREIPVMEMHDLSRQAGRLLRYRFEVPLPDAEDMLFQEL